MIPVPDSVIVCKAIKEIQDIKYKTLVAQELEYVQKNADDIIRLANKTYKQVIKGTNEFRVHNSCDFLLLEEKCDNYQVHKLFKKFDEDLIIYPQGRKR